MQSCMEIPGTIPAASLATEHLGHLDRYKGTPTYARKEQRAFVVTLSLFLLP